MKTKKKNPTWSNKPDTNKWNTPSNWKPAKVPTGTAVFSKSTRKSIIFGKNSNARVETIRFDAGAPPYTFTFDTAAENPALTISGKGIINDSGHTQSFIVASVGESFKNPQLKFANHASAGGRDMAYASGPTDLKKGYGGGIIAFCDKATAGSALFTVRTGAQAPPKGKPSTVGGEVSFSDSSTASHAHFTIYGSLGTDGDTFGNVVFHDKATADHGVFTNIGGTVKGGDGGNTQFYVNSNAAHGIFNNYGATHEGANGGDVAFDGNANGGYGQFHNKAATVAGSYGGVTSFNNNPPKMKSLGASAGHGFYFNYGATAKGQGGGGHTEFTAKYASPTGGNGHFHNYGSAINGKSSAGHTIFSINTPTTFFPTAGQGTFWNHPALTKDGAGGFTEFAIYGTGKPGKKVPTAGEATFYNLGATIKGASGGSTLFANASSAGSAKLIAKGGSNGGYGGRIMFSDESSGGSASVELSGNGELDLSYHTGPLTIRTLEMSGGTIMTTINSKGTTLKVSKELTVHSGQVSFFFMQKDAPVKLNTPYTVLSAPNLSKFKANQFKGNAVNGAKPVFTIKGKNLMVTFKKA